MKMLVMSRKITVCLIIAYLTCTTLNAIADNVPPASENHNVMLMVGYVQRNRVNFASLVPTLDIKLRESEVLKYYEVIIWEETSSVHFYEFPNDFDSWYGYDIIGVAANGHFRLRRNNVTDEQKIAYREQFLISKYTDMPEAWTDERSAFLKSAFIDIASYLVNHHPRSEHHLKYNGHGGPGGRLFTGHLYRAHANEFLNFWTQALGRPLGVIDMGGPCNKGSFAELDNFSEYAKYYIASDLPNGGYSMDEYTSTKHEETRPLMQYHNLFAAHQSLEDVLKGRIDLKRKSYEYSRNNMINNRIAQGNYLYSCAAFRKFSPNFKAFLDSVDVDYHISADLYQYMIDNKAPSSLIKQFNDVFVYQTDNKDFFEWNLVSNGMLMPDQALLDQLRKLRPQKLKVSGDGQTGVAGAQLANPFGVEVRNQYNNPLPDVPVTFTITAGGGTLSTTSTTTDKNGRAESTLTLGQQPGTNIVTVTVAALEPITFTVTGQAIPKTLTKVSGDGQTGAAGAQLANPFGVEVTDQNGAAFAGAVVTFTVTAGGGTLSTTSTTTDKNGRAESTLTLGQQPGTNTVTVTVAALEPITFTVTGQAIPKTLTKVSGDGQTGAAGAQLANPFGVEVTDQNGAAFADAAVTFTVIVGGGTLNITSTTTDKNGRAESTLTLGQQPGTNIVTVTVAGLESMTFSAISEIFDLAVPAGISLIHVPLKVTAVDGVAQTLESVGDLYDALGRAATVSLLITYDPETGRWNSYLHDGYRGRPGDKTLTDDLGIIASMKVAKSVLLSGDALGTNGRSSITLHPGINLVGVPLKDSRITRVSNLLKLNGIVGNVSVIIVSDNGFKVVAQAGDPGDIPVTGGGAFILTARNAATVEITGTEWSNPLGQTAAPSTALTGIQTDGVTPVLAVTGSISPVSGKSLSPLFRVTVKNLSTGRVDTAMTDDDGVSYQFTFVDLETGSAARVGDILEITAYSPDPFVGVQPLRHTVTDEDVKRSWISLGELVAYEIPAKTELLSNYPNPFNPETWIPYRLAKDAFVTLTIYDRSGRVVRQLEVGHRIAAVYESRAKAIYWDGRTEFGERVASGIYFYTLTAGDYSATRKMVILK